MGLMFWVAPYPAFGLETFRVFRGHKTLLSPPFCDANALREVTMRPRRGWLKLFAG